MIGFPESLSTYEFYKVPGSVRKWLVVYCVHECYWLSAGASQANDTVGLQCVNHSDKDMAERMQLVERKALGTWTIHHSSSHQPPHCPHPLGL